MQADTVSRSWVANFVRNIAGGGVGGGGGGVCIPPLFDAHSSSDIARIIPIGTLIQFEQWTFWSTASAKRLSGYPRYKYFIILYKLILFNTETSELWKIFIIITSLCCEFADNHRGLRFGKHGSWNVLICKSFSSWLFLRQI